MNAVSIAGFGASTLSAENPRKVGRYMLFEHVGQGGMARISLAREETELGATRLAVVKEILPAYAGDPRFAEMLVHEAKLAARLSHKNIVQVFDLGREGDELYIAMEYVEGLDLNGLLRRCTEHSVGLPFEHALGIVSDVLEGLDYAHRRKGEDGAPLGIVHRDVSPSNVLLSFDGEVKVCDFGIARANDLVQSEGDEQLKGKASYMSPEHAAGELIDARADVFATGIILWELLAGRRLYKQRSEVPLLEQARRADVPRLPDKGLPAHDELERIVMRALAKDREARYPSAMAMLRDLDRYLASNGLVASRLKLGDWMESTFGTELLERRRASERKLPKSSNPPPRLSGRMPAGLYGADSIPPPARVPSMPSIEAPVEAAESAKIAEIAEIEAADQAPAKEAPPAEKAEKDEAPAESLAAVDISPPSTAELPRVTVAKSSRNVVLGVAAAIAVGAASLVALSHFFMR